MTDLEHIKNNFSFLGKDLLNEIIEEGIIQEIPANHEILREGQYIKVIPIVLEGLIKVFSRYEDKELLLYYIQPKESCIMSFTACIKNDPSKIFAITEQPTKALLLPTESVIKWVRNYPSLNTLFFQQYNIRYSELLDTINHLLFDKLDKRIFDYLVNKATVLEDQTLKLTHKQIANELGTSREVVSRLIKKLERENKLIQKGSSIKIL